MRKLKKLQLKKEVITKLNNSEMEILKGGQNTLNCKQTVNYTGCYTGNSNACTIVTCTPTETTWYGF